MSGGTSSQGKKKTYQRVEILKIAEPCPLIDPSQVVVTQGEILTADPVLTPIGTFYIISLSTNLSLAVNIVTFCVHSANLHVQLTIVVLS